MRSTRVPLCVSLVAVALVAMILLDGPRAAAGAGSVEQAIAAANAEYQTIMNAASVDAGALASQFTDDAFLLIPSLQLISGRAAIGEAIAQAGGQLSGVKLETSRVELSGDLAFELGRWSSTIDGRPSSGAYLTFWRLEGSDLPVPIGPDGTPLPSSEPKWLRVASCSVPESGARSLRFENPTEVFSEPVVSAAGGDVRLLGDESVWEAAPVINDLTGQYATLFNSGNGKKFRKFVSALYRKDAIVMIPEAPLLIGQEEIVSDCEETCDMEALSNLQFDLRSLEAAKGGDMVFALSNYESDVRSETGEIFPTAGYYLAVWTRVDNDWQIAASCSSNLLYTPEIGWAVR